MLDDPQSAFERAMQAGAVELASVDEQRIPGMPPPGIVAVTADEAGRFTRFSISIQGLMSPPGTLSGWTLGNDVAGNRNAACQGLLEQPGLDWVWFIDDDHVFQSDILVKLLERRVGIVGPICLRRTQPFLPTAAVPGDYLALNDYSVGELVPVEHTGSSGMLVRRAVLEAVEPPWFELGNGISEDVNFCQKAAAAGFSVFVDMAVPLGHITTAVVWPEFDVDQNKWVIGFDVADGALLKINTIAPEPG